MAQFPLLQGAYQARGVLANAQRCINLTPEPNPKDAPFPLSHYPAPGLSLMQDMAQYGYSGMVRGLYFTSNGRPIAAIGQSILRIIGSGNAPILLGTLPTNSSNPVSMCDNGNGNSLVIVDGTSGGWTVPLSSIDTPGSMVAINDPAFFGSNHVDYIDTFLVFNRPGTREFYTTTSNVLTPFNPDYIAAKAGWNDVLVTARCLHDNIWLLGNQTTEIWFNSGAPLFPFQRMPNSILQHGCVAAYSPVILDNAIYWLSQDRWGRNMVMRGEGYTAKRISNFAIEQIWNTYGYVGDCVGMAFQYAGHETIGFYFPNAGAWWAYDASTGQWHQRTYNGVTQPWLAYSTAFWGTVAAIGEGNALLVGSRLGPQVYILDRNSYTDGGTPITRLRAWPHAVADGKRQHYQRFSLSMNGTNLSPDSVSLAWSDDGGQTFGNPVAQTTANVSNGQYQWRRLGYARDRVFQVSWSATGETVLNGAWVDAVQAGT